MDDMTVHALRSSRKAQRQERLQLGAAWQDSGFVFVREDGAPYHPERLIVMFKRLSRAAGLPVIRLHDLRHTAATLALAAGVHPKIVQERLGHSSINITLDTYSHVVKRPPNTRRPKRWPLCSLIENGWNRCQHTLV